MLKAAIMESRAENGFPPSRELADFILQRPDGF